MCQLQLCQKHYDSISIHNGTKNYVGLTESNLVPDESNNGRMYARTNFSSKTEYNVHHNALLDMRAQFDEMATLFSKYARLESAGRGAQFNG